MGSITTARLSYVLIGAALVGWSLHFYAQLQRPTVGWIEAAFGGWSVLAFGAVFALTRMALRLRAGTEVDPNTFYDRGSGRYVLLGLTLLASAGFIFLGLRSYSL